eukprot:CAMPEP_0202865106 /NCGR_PEP_ID=MMETSP1391-20130828/5265_1 /ASSEMBLY_ACC=CAM_ASM_000867 /TAXON_ID=1034604 /ORGANISM="Chlamydomonas leiostraca, Strain SAG 11-49" /LENGTH=30 /DNA_ID= /DNA_START= /DNA_END= /DNA_ORIENTATION=
MARRGATGRVMASAMALLPLRRGQSGHASF